MGGDYTPIFTVRSATIVGSIIVVSIRPDASSLRPLEKAESRLRRTVGRTWVPEIVIHRQEVSCPSGRQKPL